MKPKSFSASAISVANLCLARYKAENIDYAKGIGNSAAMTGTAVHGALEYFVTKAVMKDEIEYSLKNLLAMFDISFMETFGTTDFSRPEYLDGKQMLQGWFKRTEWEGHTVVSCEVKSSFDLPTPVGNIPFNYIWDRFDDLGDGVYEVTDYKTNRFNITPEDLKNKLQARCYALAAQIEHPDAKLIWVTFDMLRHGPIGVCFNRDENIATWKFLKAEAKRIVNFPDNDEPPETLNPDCKFCVRKASCEALKKNRSAGGAFSLSPKQRIDLRAEVDAQRSGLSALVDELDELILADAKANDLAAVEGRDYDAEIVVSSRRSVDAEIARRILGEELFAQYGKVSLTVADVTAMLKDERIPEDARKKLGQSIYMRASDPKVKTKKKGPVK